MILVSTPLAVTFFFVFSAGPLVRLPSWQMPFLFCAQLLFSISLDQYSSGLINIIHLNIVFSFSVLADFPAYIPEPFKTQWLLYVQPGITLKKLSVLPTQCIHVFLWASEQTAIIAVYSVNCLVLMTDVVCVYCTVWTEPLNGKGLIMVTTCGYLNVL